VLLCEEVRPGVIFWERGEGEPRVSGPLTIRPAAPAPACPASAAPAAGEGEGEANAPLMG